MKQKQLTIDLLERATPLSSVPTLKKAATNQSVTNKSSYKSQHYSPTFPVTTSQFSTAPTQRQKASQLSGRVCSRIRIPNTTKTEPSQQLESGNLNNDNIHEIRNNLQFLKRKRNEKAPKSDIPEQPIISTSTQDKILDLLLLSTQELKIKFNEQRPKSVRNNKLIIPKKTKLPTDFFKLLHPTVAV